MKPRVEIIEEAVEKISIARGCPSGSYYVEVKRDVERLFVPPTMMPKQFAAEIDRLNNLKNRNTP